MHSTFSERVQFNSSTNPFCFGLYCTLVRSLTRLFMRFLGWVLHRYSLHPCHIGQPLVFFQISLSRCRGSPSFPNVILDLFVCLVWLSCRSSSRLLWVVNLEANKEKLSTSIWNLLSDDEFTTKVSSTDCCLLCNLLSSWRNVFCSCCSFGKTDITAKRCFSWAADRSHGFVSTSPHKSNKIFFKQKAAS